MLINGHIILDQVRKQILVNDNRIEMGPRKFKLMEYFMQNLNKMIPTKQILLDVWGPGYSNYNQYVAVAVSEIRQLIGEPRYTRKEVNEKSIIRSKGGFGYMMVDLDLEAGEGVRRAPATDIAGLLPGPPVYISPCRGCAILPDLLAVMRDVRDLLLQVKHPLHEVTSGPEAPPVVKIDVPSVYDKVCPKTGKPHDIRPGLAYHYCNDCEHAY